MLRYSLIAFLKQVATYGFTLFMLWLVFRHLGELDLKELQLDIKGWIALIIASFLVFIANSVRAWRWAIILNDKQKIRFKDTFTSTFLGLWFNIISTTGGNVIVKPYHLSIKTKINYWKVFGSCIVERFFDAAFTLFMLIISGTILMDYLDINFFIASVIAFWITFVSFMAIIIRPYHGILKPIQWILPLRWFRKLKLLIHLLNKGALYFRDSTIMVKNISITILYWLIHIAANLVLLKSLSLPDEVSDFTAAAISTCFMSISMAIPGTIAGAGIVNYGIIVCMEMIGNASNINLNTDLKNEIFVYSLTVYLSNLIPELIVGGFYYFKEKKMLINTLIK